MTAPTPTATPEALALAAAYEAQQAQLQAQLVASLLAVWAVMGIGSPLPDPETVLSFVRAMVPASLGAQRAMVALVTNELQRQSQTPISVPVDTSTGKALRGIPIEQTYMRTFDQVRRDLDRGLRPAVAFDRGLRRLQTQALTDLQLAKTHATRDFATQLQARKPGVIVGFRRVLSSKPNHCALCILASTQRYRSFDLMAIHPGCGCGVALIIGDEDPGKTIDATRVEDIHDIIARDLGPEYVNRSGTGLAAYRDILVTHEHGEMGPVLGVRGQHFEGPVQALKHERVNPLDDDVPPNGQRAAND